MFYSYTGDSYNIKQKIKQFNLPIVYVDSIESLGNEVFETGLFNDVKCYVTINETIDAKLISKLQKSPNTIVDILTNPNTRTVVYKQAIEIKPLTAEQMVNQLSKKTNLDKESLTKLVNLCHLDMIYSQIELNKINNSDVDLFELNMIGDIELNIIDIYKRNFLSKNYTNLFILNQKQETLDNLLLILYYIYSSMKDILSVNGNQNFTAAECKNIIKQIYILNRDMKQGLVKQEYLLDMLLLRCL